MTRFVGDSGPQGAQVVLVGEAPGQHEQREGRPFVGPAGWKLNEWLRRVGLDRGQMYVTNVYPYRPPGNKIEAVPKQELEPWIEDLHRRLGELDDPWVIVPTGNTALRALIGKSKITSHRGSIYEYVDRRGRHVKVIPTIHPAAVFRTPSWERRCVCDWKRIAGDREFRELRLPQREHFTKPTVRDVEDFVDEVMRLGTSDAMALDIETPGGVVGCVGFSYEPGFSMTIPTTLAYWQSEDTTRAVWEMVKLLCALPVAKVTHNGLFDAFHLADYGVRLVNWQWDTLALHHALDSTDEHSLAYCASLDTRQPYWKDMRDPKDDGEGAVWKGPVETLWIYNGVDSCVTRELADVYATRLAERGALKFYDRHYRQMLRPLLRTMRHGVRLDEPTRRRQYAKLIAECVDTQERLTVVAGGPLHSTARNKKRDEAGKIPDLSTKKIATYLYETLRLPKQVNRKTGGVTTAEVTVRRLMNRYGMAQFDERCVEDPEAFEAFQALHPQTSERSWRLSAAGTLILEHRRKKKLSEFLDEGKLDPDGRLRCSYRFTTETGRLSSSKNPRGTGRNLQNIDRELRHVFLADEGCVFVEVDLSQAESRVVYVLTGDPKMIEIARSMPWEFDVHRYNAGIIFKKAPKDVTAKERYLGKRACHASHYGQQGRMLSDILLLDGYTVPPEQAQEMINTYMEQHASILDWQRDTRRTVLTTRTLVNSWGRMIEFAYDRMDDDLFRRAYAWVPQSEVADLLNQWGYIPLDRAIREQGLKARINLQNHDALLVSCPKEEVWTVVETLRRSLERPRRYRGVELMIPCEFGIGNNWGKKIEFKRSPTRDEVEEAVCRLTG